MYAECLFTAVNKSLRFLIFWDFFFIYIHNTVSNIFSLMDRNFDDTPKKRNCSFSERIFLLIDINWKHWLGNFKWMNSNWKEDFFLRGWSYRKFQSLCYKSLCKFVKFKSGKFFIQKPKLQSRIALFQY